MTQNNICPNQAPLVAKGKGTKQMISDVCQAALGDFGLWQLRSIFLISLVKIPSAWQMACILFTAPSPGKGNFWCARPPQYRHWDVQRWINLSHSSLPDEPNMRDPCNLYDMSFDILTNDEETDTFENLNTTDVELRRCEEFEFNTSHTVVKQWQLVCGREILVSISQLFYLLGILIGGFLCWRLLFRYSPRKIILSAIIVQVIAGTSITFTDYLEIHMLLRFVTAAACAHMFTSGYIICTDITNGKCRIITGACYEYMWSLGVITLACLAYVFNNWPDLQLAISVPTLFVLLFYRWIPDSPKWLLSNGFPDEAKRILEEAADFNKRTKIDVDLPNKETKREDDVRWKDIFGSQGSLTLVCALHIAWAATVVNYYGGLLNVKNLGANLIINTGAAGFAEMIGILFGLVLLLWCNRKWLLLGVILILGGCACVLCWFIPYRALEYQDAIMMTLAMTGRISIACSLTVLQVSSAELLPDVHRSLGTVSSVTFARMFLLTAPFIGSLAMYGKCVSLSAFGSITVLGGMATLVLYFTSQNTQKINNLHL